MRTKTLVLCSTAMVVAAAWPLGAAAQASSDPAATSSGPNNLPTSNPPTPGPDAPAPDAASGNTTGTPTAQTGTTAAQPNANNTDDAIVVTGIRASLASSQGIKQRSVQVVDAVVAEDIGKLTDLNTAETVARLPGIQVYRQGGEAQNVLVRGLPFFTTTYNGREIFTAETRVVALQDFPSSNIAALEVYKTSTADLVEPGIAGIVNVRSRKPFDFEDAQISGSAWGLFTRQGNTVTPNFNVLATKRFDTGIGEIGILVQGSYQKMRYLDAEISNTDFIADPQINGQTTRLPDIQRLFYRSGTRERPSGNVQLQWQASPDLEFYAEGLYQGFINKVDDRLLENPLYNGASYSNLVYRDGTNLLRSGTVTGSTGNLFSFQGATLNRTNTYQFAAGAHYNSGPFKLTVDAARSLSTFRGKTESLDRIWAGNRTTDFNFDDPSFTIGGIDFYNPAAQTFQGLFEENQKATGHDWQVRADAQYDFDNSVLQSIQIGARWSDRNARRNDGSRYTSGVGPDGNFINNLLGNAIPATALPVNFEIFRGYDFQSTYNFSAPTYASIRDNLTALRQLSAAQCLAAGITDPASGCGSYIATDGGPVASPLIFRATERTIAGYGQVNFGFGDNIKGVVGLRVQNSKLNLPAIAVQGGTAVSINRSETDLLPNANLNIKLPASLQARFAFSKTVTRPEFGQLGGLILGAPPSGGVGTGSNPYPASGGNPFLKPFTSYNYDVSLEYYPSKAGFAAVTVFHRDLNRFIINQTQRFNDPTLGVLEINGPINAGKGRITGVEAQGQTFFDFAGLPSWAKAFGIQANVTYLDFKLQQQSDINGGLAYQTYADQFNGVSKWNYNIAGLFESGQISGRLTYNGRSKFTASRQFRTATNGGVTTLDDIYTETAKPAGRLDLSLQYGIFKNGSIFADWTNITRDPFKQYFSSGRAGATQADYIRYYRYDESTISLGVRFTI